MEVNWENSGRPGMRKIRRRCNVGDGNQTSIADLPDTILIDIISRLPLRRAKRCAAVCKAWYNLLVKDDATSSYMQRRYQMSSSNSSSFSLLTNMTTLSTISGDRRLSSWVETVACSSYEEDTAGICSRRIGPFTAFDGDIERLRYNNKGVRTESSSSLRHEVVACCNDVLLCEEWPRSRENGCAYYVWGPLSGDDNWVALPKIPFSSEDAHTERRRFMCGLACDQDGSFTVVCIAASKRATRRMLMHTFSNKEDSSGVWKEHQVDWPAGKEFQWDSQSLQCPQGVMYKGFMFWLGAKHAVFGVDPCRRRHDPLLVDLPPEFQYSGNHKCLGVCRGSLTVVQMSDNPSPLDSAYVAIWILDHGSSSSSSVNNVDEFGHWSLHKRVSLQQVIESPPPFQQPPTSDHCDARLSPRLKLLGRHPFDLNIVYFRVWRTVYSLDLSTMEALGERYEYPSDTYPSHTSKGLPEISFTFIHQWRPTPISRFADVYSIVNYLES